MNIGFVYCCRERSRRLLKRKISYWNILNWVCCFLVVLSLLHFYLYFIVMWSKTTPRGMQANIYGACPKPG